MLTDPRPTNPTQTTRPTNLDHTLTVALAAAIADSPDLAHSLLTSARLLQNRALYALALADPDPTDRTAAAYSTALDCLSIVVLETVVKNTDWRALAASLFARTEDDTRGSRMLHALARAGLWAQTDPDPGQP